MRLIGVRVLRKIPTAPRAPIRRTAASRARFSQSVPIRDNATSSITSGKGDKDAGWQQHGYAKPHGRRGLKLTVSAVCAVAGWFTADYVRNHGDTTASDNFVKYKVVQKEDVSSTCSIFTLEPVSSKAIPLDDPALRRAVTSIEFKQPQLQIARSYTLLPPLPDQRPNQLRFLIRKERNGEMSGYIHKLVTGAGIEVRGPFIEHMLPGNVERVLFLAGGTGIAPAMQVAQAVAGDADVHVLWATRKRQDCTGGQSDNVKSSTSPGRWLSQLSWPIATPNADAEKGSRGMIQSPIVQQLDHMKTNPRATIPKSRLEVDYFIDEEGTFVKPADVQNLISRYKQDDKRKKVLFVSGPNGFVNHWAGPKEWRDGREVQGPLGGELAKMHTSGWEIVKL